MSWQWGHASKVLSKASNRVIRPIDYHWLDCVDIDHECRASEAMLRCGCCTLNSGCVAHSGASRESIAWHHGWAVTLYTSDSCKLYEPATPQHYIMPCPVYPSTSYVHWPEPFLDL